jgi:hypothetical protein
MKTPPLVAVWLLTRLVNVASRESLLGDLFEQHALGKSNTWFWRQTLGALAVNAWSELRAHYVAITLCAHFVGFSAAAALGTIKTAPGLGLFDASLAAFGAGWLVARVGGFTTAVAFTALVTIRELPALYELLLAFLDHFGGLWLITTFGMDALPSSVVWTALCILAGALLGTRPRSGNLAQQWIVQ